MSQNVKTKATANPTKGFFVKMITRDITLEDCIFDLIDNSIDGAWEQEGGRPVSLEDSINLAQYRISVEIDSHRFSIHDNCGGISLDDAAEYAFTFGRKVTAKAEDFSIGVYGIGMKRAVFKIGSKVEICSTYMDGDDLNSFKVPIDVNEWLDLGDENWDFEIDEAEKLDEAGVKIEVKELYPVTAQLFSSQRFVQDLCRTIGRDYAIHLDRGLTIEVNGKSIDGWSIRLKQGGEFAPMRTSVEVPRDGEDVSVEILAGMEASPPQDIGPDGEWDKDQSRFGWYVVCNGRIVLAADKTALTGWGTDGLPQWHPQYAGFMGLILFSSRRAELLPLTTTKRNIDVSSSLYLQFRSFMREASRAWIDYTNARKRSDIEEVFSLENMTKAIPISEVAPSKDIKLPQKSIGKRVPEANVLYSVPRDRLRELANAFGYINMSYKDVGRKSFEYAYEDLIGDE